jgi:hypothetical protein
VNDQALGRDTYVNPPDKTPAHPRPANALPTIKVGEFGAEAHIRQPASRIARDARNTIFG